ncbi:MAG: HEPN domain-containing protein [Euryarchaeota archaeon]|nr:HEPN domain-containing protein [Euryarchaeota archaeon]
MERLPKTRAAVYLAKATHFHRMMSDAYSTGNSDGAALAAVHCVISALDAVTVAYLGERSRGPDHADVLALVSKVSLPDVREKASQAKNVLAMKNVVEYEDRHVSPDETEIIVKEAERVLRWATRRVGGP